MAQRPSHALGLLRHLRQQGLQCDSATWGGCIFATRKSWRRALGLLTQLRRQLRWELDQHMAARSVRSAFPDLHSLVGATNAALGSCALGKRWRNAVDVLSHLGRVSLQGNEISRQALMASFGADVACPWQLLLRFTGAASAVAKQQEWARALTLYDGVLQPDPFALGVVMEVGLTMKAAPKLCEELQQLGLEAARLSGRKKCRGFFFGDGLGTNSE